MSYQKITGPLMANTHPGSYRGQDAYNDMFVTDELLHRKRTNTTTEDIAFGRCAELYARSAGNPGGGYYGNSSKKTHTKGKVHKECSDSARYKALGNSIALPYWFWLLRRISAQYERPATLGSLFDGIGGFPLCWERCNGSGTARWASEIEEFPIAVTQYRLEEGNERWKP